MGKFLLSLFTGIFCAPLSPQLFAENRSFSPEQEKVLLPLKQLSQKTAQIISSSLLDQEKKNQLFTLLDSFFNMTYLAPKAIGPEVFKTFNPAQQQEYFRLFKIHIVNVYYNLLKKYYQQDTLHFQGVKFFPSPAETWEVMSSTINPENRQKVEVKWRLDRNVKIINMEVAGSSLFSAITTDVKALWRKSGSSTEQFLRNWGMPSHKQ